MSNKCACCQGEFPKFTNGCPDPWCGRSGKLYCSQGCAAKCADDPDPDAGEDGGSDVG